MKAPRERLVTLHVEAAPCVDVFEHVLRLVTMRIRTPADVAVRHGTRTMDIDIVFDRAVFGPSTAFIAKLEDIPAVRSADIFDCRGQSLFAVVDGGEGSPLKPFG